VAQARKADKAQAEEAPGRELPVIYTGDRQLVVVRHDALAALQLANRPPRYFRRVGFGTFRCRSLGGCAR
jgi:hypothetical protein